MKVKSFIVTLVTLFTLGYSALNAHAQEVFRKGTQTGSFLVGLPPSFDYLLVPPIHLAYEYGVADRLINGNNGSIGLGAEMGFYSHGIHKHGWGARVGVRNVVIGARSSFHYQFIPKLDTYAGLFLGVRMRRMYGRSYDDDDYYYDYGTYTSSELGWNAHLGIRYYLSPSFALNLELGYGYSVLDFGVTFRF